LSVTSDVRGLGCDFADQLGQHNRTRKAIFEFDKLIRSIYTLRYLCDAQLQRNVHGSQNRIEAYHQLRSAIAQVGGKKQLSGKTGIDIQISNQCGRLIANATIYYQLRHPFAAARQISNGQKLQSIRPSQDNLSGRLAAYPLSRSLHFAAAEIRSISMRCWVT
jgi:Tn3 transposase DDE domain